MIDKVWQITGTDSRSGAAVQTRLIAVSEAEVRERAAAIHIRVTDAQELPSTAQAAGASRVRTCPHCGTTAEPQSRYQGSRTVSSILFFVFFPAAILYELWRHGATQWVCPNCDKAGMVPTPADGEPC